MEILLEELKKLNKSIELASNYFLLLEQDLSKEDKEKLIIFQQELAQIIKKYSNSEIIATNDTTDEFIKTLLKKGSYLINKIKQVKRTTKQGITEQELQTLKLWDNCEKLLKILQNKTAISNQKMIEAKEKGTTLLNNKKEELKNNTNWKDLVKESYFNYQEFFMKCMTVKEIRSLLKRIKSKKSIKISADKNTSNEEINKLLEETEKLLQGKENSIEPIKENIFDTID